MTEQTVLRDQRLNVASEHDLFRQYFVSGDCCAAGQENDRQHGCGTKSDLHVGASSVVSSVRLHFGVLPELDSLAEQRPDLTHDSTQVQRSSSFNGKPEATVFFGPKPPVASLFSPKPQTIIPENRRFAASRAVRYVGAPHDEVRKHPLEQEIPQRVLYRDGSVGDG
jgi:hypothetical protein